MSPRHLLYVILELLIVLYNLWNVLGEATAKSKLSVSGLMDLRLGSESRAKCKQDVHYKRRMKP